VSSWPALGEYDSPSGAKDENRPQLKLFNAPPPNQLSLSIFTALGLMPHFPDDDAIIAVLEAVASRPQLRDRFVLKGGNALKLVFMGPRGSVDVDMSDVERSPDQREEETQRVLDMFCDQLNSALEDIAPHHGYAEMVVQSTEIKPANKNPRDFPALEVKVGYSELEDRTPPYSDVVKVEITLNEIVCDTQYAAVGSAEVQVSSLNDIMAEKLRALLQQVPRNRNRPNDVFDIWFYTTRAGRALDQESVSRFLVKKSIDKEGLGTVTRQMFYHPDVRSRAAVGWNEIEERLPASVELPDFNAAFEQVLAFVDTLDLEEGHPSDLAE
jgi:predicted nucleotidyltransferase component of viral defense system